MKNSVNLREDCTKCAALCCVSLAFDRSKLFAIEKANGEICPKLTENGLCSIHSQLEIKGFAGCMRYTCNGAGQRVVQQVFSGRNWLDNRELLEPMLEAYESMCRVHELLLLLREAGKLALSAEKRETIAEFTDGLNPSGGWTSDLLKEFSRGKVTGEIQRFFRSLKACVAK